MKESEKEKMLDLLCDKFVYGLSEEEARELENLGYDADDAESIELTIAALGLAGLDSESEMPAHLAGAITAEADKYFSNRTPSFSAAVPVESETNVTGRPWFNWLGWGLAAAASIALAVNLFVFRGDNNLAVNPGQPTPTPEERLDPARERQKLMESSPGEMVMAEWGAGNVKDMPGIAGDVVWSDAKQTGYMRFRGLPRNDTSQATYQLWIFDETQDPKTPIDGGTFDVTADGEVVIPINAKLKARKPSAFAVTIEKPGGVVVSKREKIAALAPVKPRQA